MLIFFAFDNDNIVSSKRRVIYITPVAVHYEKIRNHLREMATNNVNIHSLARKYEHLRINQIQ